MSRRCAPTPFFAVVALLIGCEPASDAAMDGGRSADTRAADVVQITASDFEFDAPDRIPSGWTTIRFTNEGEEEHFASVYRLPDSVTFARYRQAAQVQFSAAWDDYAAGDIGAEELGSRLGEVLPDWFFSDIQAAGGAALTEPGETSTVTVHLAPGTYVIECYVKTPQATWHTDRGMLAELTVTEEDNGAAEPTADAEVRLANYTLTAPDELPAGEQTIAVRVEDRPEGFTMHDVNLFRLDADTGVEDLVAWMNWMDLDQFRAPAPGYSLGGVDNMAEGRTGYMEVDLEPGRYAWVSEGYGAQGMAKEFTVR